MAEKLKAGWAIFDSDTRGLEIERLDEEEIFETDEEAIAHVFAQPMEAADASSYQGCMLSLEGEFVAECHHTSKDIYQEIVRRWNTHSELLEALKGALDYMGDSDGECALCGGNGTTLEYHKQCSCYPVRAAIAKATREDEKC